MHRASSLNNTFQGVILLPPDYPVIKSKTTLKILSDIVIAEAIRDIASIENFKRDENKFGYLLGTKTYNDFAGKFLFGVATGKTDLTYILITPYSAVRYESWKASKQFKPISQKVINDNISRKNLVCIAVAPADAFTTNFWETRFGYAGMKHAASITNVVIRKNIIVYQSLEHEGDKWYFPIDLFTSNEPIEIIAVDNDNEQKIIKVSSDKSASFK